ncbi:hypothetical protein [Halomarina rubra]|uniref:Uncharacterized protein n=1 Tax=Halomarina rubra TaxID=2071873 RepID=A0ABD6ARI9_9EURY|nr:hypothetical protein [Halomarina rubra]
MSNTYVYTLVIPNSAQQAGEQRQRRAVAASNALSGSTPAVESVGSQPGERTLRGQYRGALAKKMGRELAELSSAGDVETVPIYTDTADGLRGYYALEEFGVGNVDPRFGEAVAFDGRITKKGTSQTHWRATQTNPGEVVNPLGNDLTAEVGVPAAATKVRWLDESAGKVEPATILETRSGEFGDVDVVDATASSFEDPTLIFELDYAEEGKTDPTAWDDRGVAKLSDEDVLQWARVFDTGHEFEGSLVVDNGLIRLQLDETSAGLSEAHWDGAAWSDAALGPNPDGWTLFDADLRRCGTDRVEARCEFVDDAGSFYTLNATVARGADAVRWTRPENATKPTPTSLKDYLVPTASAIAMDAGATDVLVARDEVAT